jgi:hypothetical protein
MVICIVLPTVLWSTVVGILTLALDPGKSKLCWDSPQPRRPKVVLKLLGELVRNVVAIEENVPGKASEEEIDDILK